MISASHRSSSDELAALWLGNAPTTPAQHASATKSGPDTSVIGAAMAGIRRRSVHSVNATVVPLSLLATLSEAAAAACHRT
ncbi:hypothetical protein NBCG_01828 [Nocardioidaceae bacterium Broad-1]|nr:hypothetical protein NBCG_01828 [Nocardioidaceae bacterium Broad-1]